MTAGAALTNNLLSPPILAFVLGVGSKIIRSDVSLPKDAFTAIAGYLLFALGMKGGVELAQAPASQIAVPALATLLLGIITPLSSYFLLRRAVRLSAADSAGIAAHYGSVSAVTFMAAQGFATAQGSTPEGFMATLLTLLETPGINIALAIGLMSVGGGRSMGHALREVFTSRGLVLLMGGLMVGSLTGEKNWNDVSLFFEPKGPIFRGCLCLFLLHMGSVAAERLGDLRKVGPRLALFAIVVPVLHGALGVWLGHVAGLGVGGATVLGAMAASASYIAAPPAVRLTLPEANPTLYLTCALAVTFPFNLVAGIPLYHHFASLLAG